MRDEADSDGELKCEYLNEPDGDDRNVGYENQIMTEKTKLMCLLPVIIFVFQKKSLEQKGSQPYEYEITFLWIFWWVCMTDLCKIVSKYYEQLVSI